MLVFITPSVIRSPEDMQTQFNQVLEERMKDFRSNLSQQRSAMKSRGVVVPAPVLGGAQHGPDFGSAGHKYIDMGQDAGEHGWPVITARQCILIGYDHVDAGGEPLGLRAGEQVLQGGGVIAHQRGEQGWVAHMQPTAVAEVGQNVGFMEHGRGAGEVPKRAILMGRGHDHRV